MSLQKEQLVIFVVVYINIKGYVTIPGVSVNPGTRSGLTTTITTTESSINANDKLPGQDKRTLGNTGES